MSDILPKPDSALGAANPLQGSHKIHLFAIRRVPTAQGKREMATTKIPVRENTGNLEILPKHREFGLL